jgi:hypothetical protein
MSTAVRIGCGAGFWGDTAEGSVQLVRSGSIDYLVMDYLAEITMSLLARARAKRPELGYATDFVSAVMTPLAADIAAKRIRVVTNAGGVNPRACRDALVAVFAKLGVDLKVAVVSGDDLTASADELRARDVREMFSGAPFPGKLASINAYLGARPIAAALAAGADVVVTGRCVDSALVLGPLIHEFGWAADDYDKLAAGSLVGHIVECGVQATGGLFTDWRRVEGWERMGFPIAECAGDGSFVITKPANTGGLVTTQTVAEQIVYEVGDPAAYVLPDVTCDFSNVKLTQIDLDRVQVSGARGGPPPATYKVSATYPDGFRATAVMMIGGWEAAAKAARVAEAILARVRRLIAEAGFNEVLDHDVEVLGSEATYGPHSRARAAREVVLKIGVRHPRKEALDIFAREIYPAGTAMAQGITGFAGGRPTVQPVTRLFSCLVPMREIPVSVEIDGEILPVALPPVPSSPPAKMASAVRGTSSVEMTEAVAVPLLALAHGRSGDKGDIANIGILARRPEFLPLLRHQLTAEAVGAYFAHIIKGRVERFEWPGLRGFNFLLHEALGGGGMASLRHDPQGKAYAQMLLDLRVVVPSAWLRPGGLLANWQDEIGFQGEAA